MSDGKGGGAFYGALVLVGAVVGIGILGAIRYSRPVEETHVHYHANWAVFVDGQRLDLSGNEYMEDVFQCMADPSSQTPETRIHMHENNQDVVHVHDSGTTWDHLLANLGFGIGHDYFDSGKMRLQNDGTRTLKFVLNGRLVTSVRNVPVRSEDRLLISFGPEAAADLVGTQFEQVATNAGEFNTMPDPASCSGATEPTTAERVRDAFWF